MRFKLLKLVIGEKRYQEYVIASKRFTILNVNTRKNTVSLIDNHKGRKVFNVIKMKAITEYVLWCVQCCSPKCDHTLFAYYIPELGRVALYGTKLSMPEVVKLRLQSVNIKSLLMQGIIPALLITVFSIELLPFFTIAPVHSWYDGSIFHFKLGFIDI